MQRHLHAVCTSCNAVNRIPATKGSKETRGNSGFTIFIPYFERLLSEKSYVRYPNFYMAPGFLGNGSFQPARVNGMRFGRITSVQQRKRGEAVVCQILSKDICASPCRHTRRRVVG